MFSKHVLRRSAYLEPVWWKIKKEIDLQHLQRLKAFLSRILADFTVQWRHVLCGSYNNLTCRKLAYAIVQIVTLDFSITEASLPHPDIDGFLVWVDSYPEWPLTADHIVRVGGISIAVCQHTPHAIALIRQDFTKRVESTPGLANKSLTYLILSVREFSVYKLHPNMQRITEPMRLFDGINPPSDEAIEILLHATQTTRSMAPLHKLPLEVQDMILDEISTGSIEKARMGCLLNARSAFA